MTAEQSGILLLPDPCLLAVLRCCAGDPGSVCSAARAHSKLHQAAVEALSSIDALLNQDELDNLVDVYLSKHGQHMESISLEGVGYSGILHQLAPNLTKLSSLGLISLDLRLQPGSGYPSVLGAAAAPTLKQLRLDGCRLAVSSLTGRNNGLAAALALLPELEHLALADMTEVFIPGDVWLKMSRLTYLELEGAHMQGPGPGDNIDLQHLSVVTQLVDLRLSGLYDHNIISVGKLPGLQHLTRLQLTHNGDIDFEPAALAGKTWCCRV